EGELQILLLPKNPDDDRSVFLEIRAGTGGDESALFAGDLLRMYTRYAETRGWRVELMSESASELGGYKEVIAHIEGDGVYGRLKFESGAHRVQRVPETESQGRVHRSEEHTSELQSRENLVCRLLLEKKKPLEHIM